MLNQSAYLYGLIVGCEAAFWFVLALALVARYVFRRIRLSRILLYALPVVDLLLFVFTALDLRSGTPAAFAHGLATAYVGFTIAFGALLVDWADQRFAHRFAGGPPPVALIAYVDREADTQELQVWFRIAFVSVVLWFVFGPVWNLVFFRRELPK